MTSDPIRPSLQPPVAEQQPVHLLLHGEDRVDPYAWMRDRDDPRVRAHLSAENAYTDAMMADTVALQERLYAEMLGRIQQTDLSVPWPKGGFLYYTRTLEGKQYPIHCRRTEAADSPEQVLVDVNLLAEGHAFMALGDFEPSPDGALLAYTTDSTGYRQYRLTVLDLRTGAALPVSAERVTSVAWSADGTALYFTQEDEVSKRSHQLHRMTLADGATERLFEEPDERFSLSIRTTRSGEWLVLDIGSHTTSEIHVLDAAAAGADFRCVAARRQDIEYSLDHRGDVFWIRVNDTGREFRVVTAPVGDPGMHNWTEVVAHREQVTITGITCFRDHVVFSERENALPHLAVWTPADASTRRVPFVEAAYSVGPGTNETFATRRLRYSYQSFLTPPSVFELDLDSLESTLLKRQEVLGGYDSSRYLLERFDATAPDGTAVPVTLLARRDLVRDGSAPCLLYGYGAYGMPSHVLFSSNRFSLVDRGMVYALAHIRGGGDKGQRWHDDGRMSGKMNTFTDFIACAEALVERRIASAAHLVIQGGSAGGLLMGAVTNLRPELWCGVLNQVPFVDVINTMLDEQLPLTVGEFEEWGDPKREEHYRWIRAYSPYDNLRAGAYPAMLVKTGLNDSQVGYWEPAKYVARLRELKRDSTPLLLKVNMGAGHGGASGRYDYLKEIAFDYAWILRRVGLEQAAI